MLALRRLPQRSLLRLYHLADSCVLKVLLTSSSRPQDKHPPLTGGGVRAYDSQIQNYLPPAVPKKRESSKSAIQKNLPLDSESEPAKKTSKNRLQYIITKDVMDKLVVLLQKDLRRDDIIVEFSPGVGNLTEGLLASTDNNMVLYEPSKVAREYLNKTRFPRYSSRLQLVGFNFENFPYYYIMDASHPENSVLGKFVEPLPARGQKTVSSVKVVGITESKKFMRNLVISAAVQSCLFEEIIPVFCIYLKKETYAFILKQCPWAHFFLHLEVHGECVITKLAHNRNKTDSYVLLKISLNEEIFTQVPKKELTVFYYFLRCVFSITKPNTIITFLERWIPDCGLHWLKNGGKVVDHPQTMTAEQILMVYQTLTHHPLFGSSEFTVHARKFVTYRNKSNSKDYEEDEEHDGHLHS